MPAPKLTVHIPDARLFKMAVVDNLVFTGDEFSHLKQCPICCEQWKRYIREYVHDDDRQNARIKRGE